jgi:hypothetical protein
MPESEERQLGNEEEGSQTGQHQDADGGHEVMIAAACARTRHRMQSAARPGVRRGGLMGAERLVGRRMANYKALGFSRLSGSCRVDGNTVSLCVMGDIQDVHPEDPGDDRGQAKGKGEGVLEGQNATEYEAVLHRSSIPAP